MNQFCKGCLKKPTCKKICKQLEEHLKNDIEIKWREEYLTEEQENHLNGSKRWPQTIIICEAVISLFFVKKKKQIEIAKELKISQPYVSQIVKKYRPILKQNIKKTLISRL